MPKYIIKLRDDKLSRDWYLEWSTIVDAPITFGMSREEFEHYYLVEYGEAGMRDDFSERMRRVEENGTSGPFGLHSLLVANRAGTAEAHLGYEEIVERYCRKRAQ